MEKNMIIFSNKLVVIWFLCHILFCAGGFDESNFCYLPLLEPTSVHLCFYLYTYILHPHMHFMPYIWYHHKASLPSELLSAKLKSSTLPAEIDSFQGGRSDKTVYIQLSCSRAVTISTTQSPTSSSVLRTNTRSSKLRCCFDAMGCF